MKSLLVASRFPLPPYTGDRLRTLIWLEAMSASTDLTLVCPPGNLGRSDVRHISARRSSAAFASSLARAGRSGLPMHALIAANYDWRRALNDAGSDFDVAVVLLSRLDPWAFHEIHARRFVLDAIDSLAMSVAERARQARGPMRLFWKREVSRTATLEKDVISRYDRIVVVSEEERALFGERAIAVPNGVEIAPLDAPRRSYDFGFWGRLSYFANRDAARILLDRLWPEIRRRCPRATLFIGGADAPDFVRDRDGSDGVTVESPMNDRTQALRSIRTALFPIRYGTGQSNKILEAGEAGCAIVSTMAGVRGLEDLAAVSLVADDERGIVDAACSLFDEPSEAEAMGARLRSLVVANYDRRRSLQRLIEIVHEERSTP
ncbi:MAG: glycosyltransferase [Acidobacteriota bacterium]